MDEISDKDMISALEDRIVEKEELAKECELRNIAFIIHKFCGGKIEYTTDEIADIWLKLDVVRTYKDGVITICVRKHQEER